MAKITDKIAVKLMKGQIKQHLTAFFNIYKGMKESWLKSGAQQPFEEFIELARVEFESDFNSVINKMMNG